MSYKARIRFRFHEPEEIYHMSWSSSPPAAGPLGFNSPCTISTHFIYLEGVKHCVSFV